MVAVDLVGLGKQPQDAVRESSKARILQLTAQGLEGPPVGPGRRSDHRPRIPIRQGLVVHRIKVSTIVRP